MITTRKLRKAGNSSVVSVPTEVIAALGISNGDNLKFNVKDNKVTIEKEVREDEEFLNCWMKHSLSITKL